jgi:hypothetical protein
MQNQQNQTPAADAAGDDEAALWRELDDQDNGTAAAAPPAQGHAEATDPEPGPEFAPEQDSPPQDEAAAPARADAAEQPADIWASAPPELRAAFEQERRSRTNLEHQIRSDRGRLSAMQRKLEEAARQSPNPAHRPKQGENAQDRTKRLTKLAEEYPEVAQPILDEMDALRSTVASLQTLEQHRQRQAFTYHENALAQQHPDWNQVLANNGATFQNWIEDQPKAVRDAAMANANQIVNAQAAAAVISRFKHFIGIGEQPQQQQAPQQQGSSRPPLNDRRQRQLAAASAPRAAGGRSVATGIPEDGDPEAIWAAFEAQEAHEARQRR